MSHFVVYALVGTAAVMAKARREAAQRNLADHLAGAMTAEEGEPQAGDVAVKDPNDPLAVIEALMAPYSEALEVPEYDRKCWCVGREAKNAATAECERAHGPFEDIRKGYWKRVNAACMEVPEIAALEALGEAMTDEQKEQLYKLRSGIADKVSWDDHIKGWVETEKAFLAGRDDLEKPDPECDECSGTGLYKSAYNPDTRRIVFCPGRMKGHEGKEVGCCSGHEALSPVLTRQAIEGLFAGKQESGRPVHVLSFLPEGEELKAHSGTAAEVVSEADVRHGTGGVQSHASAAERGLCDLREARTGEQESCSGSLSQDGEGALSLVRELQYRLGPSGGRFEVAGCGSEVPHGPHVIRESLIGGAKWDWYRPGGRWDGYITGNPQSDADGGFNFADTHESLDNNSLPATKLIVDLEGGADRYPFAVLTPDGEWHEKGDMGWFGMVAGEKDADKWHSQVLALLKANSDTTVVALDCHI